MTPPTFTVVMPACDTASTIGAAIESALAQTRPELEVIVVDDGSTDATAAIARRFETDARVTVLSQRRAGPGAARNAAIARATGRYVSMLDSDDLWLPTYLAAVGEALDRNPGVGLAHTGHWTLEEPPGRIRREAEASEPLMLDPRAFLVRLARVNILVNSTVTVRRAVLEQVGGCSTTLAAAVDYELWLRIAAAGHGVLRVPGRHAVYRQRRGSIQNDPRNELASYESLRDVYRALAEEWDVPEEVKDIARGRRAAIEHHMEVLTGQRRLEATLLALRRRAATARRRLWSRGVWYAEPPPEVAAMVGARR